ncbi:MAG: dTDP-4-dehydrorhamnose reductase [Candidatus Zixiibacteriota bacterium]|nr:MAG: dTDP-4-dehydrorhamnose reductase [candidate division Zixibacteria bacterium]
MVAERMMITGASGLLGADLVSYFSGRYEVIPVSSKDFNVTDRHRTITFIEQSDPDIILHAAALADVDACEQNEELTMATNAVGSETIALASREVRAKLVYYSTDYVFDGTKDMPYVEDDTPNPINIYGKSKLAGEELVANALTDAVILRVAWLYGYGAKSFVTRLIRRGQKQLEKVRAGQSFPAIRMVSDQIGTPTWTIEVAAQTGEILKRNLKGLYHCTAGGACSRYDLALTVYRVLEMEINVEACRRGDFAPDRAPRPGYTVLANERLAAAGCDLMRDYGTALLDYLRRRKNINDDRL